MNGISIRRLAPHLVLVATFGFARSPPCNASDDWPTYRMPTTPSDMSAYAMLVGIRSSFDQCFNGPASAKLASCTGIEYDYQRRRLDRGYRQLKASLDKELGQQLRDQQQRWVLWRDSRCNAGPESFVGYICQIEITADRATQLEYRVAHHCYKTRCGRALNP